MEQAEKNNGCPLMDICGWRVTTAQKYSGADQRLQGQCVERRAAYFIFYYVWTPENCVDCVISLVVQYVLIFGSLFLYHWVLFNFYIDNSRRPEVSVQFFHLSVNLKDILSDHCLLCLVQL